MRVTLLARVATLATGVTLSVALATSSAALADAVPPPPAHCPPGQIGVTSHGGPACVLVAPKDCGPGWTGREGGTCALSLCDPAGDACGNNGGRCAPENLCVVEVVRTWGWGSAVLPPQRGPELAEPPHVFAKPQHDFYAVDVCGPDASCASGHCEALHVCLPPGRDQPVNAAGAGHPTEQAYVRRVSEENLDDDGGANGAPPSSGGAIPEAGEAVDASVADGGAPAAPSVHDVPGNAPKSGGCAGCASASSSGSLAGAGVALLVGIALLVRRRG